MFFCRLLVRWNEGAGDCFRSDLAAAPAPATSFWVAEALTEGSEDFPGKLAAVPAAGASWVGSLTEGTDGIASEFAAAEAGASWAATASTVDISVGFVDKVHINPMNATSDCKREY